jgi:hypothetical protein
MIEQFFENPNKPAKPVYKYSGAGISGVDQFYATKKGLTLEEFRRRDAIVREEARLVTYFKGDVMYPFSHKEYVEKGKCRIQGIYRTYGEMESDEWPAHDKPYIVTAHRMDTPGEVFFTTGGYFVRHVPTDTGE